MKSELYTQLIQYLSIDQTPSDMTYKKKEEHSLWKGRSTTETNTLRSEIKRLLKPDASDKITDMQLLKRVCTLGDVDNKLQESLSVLCSSSPEKGAEALTEVLIKAAEKNTSSQNQFYKELQDWVEQGEKGEKRTEAAEEIIRAYKSNSQSLSLNNLGLKSVPNIISELSHVMFLSFENNQLKTLPNIFENLPSLCSIILNKNPIEHFPKALYANKNECVSVKMNDTPIISTILTPGMKRKIINSDWIFEARSNNRDRLSKAFQKSHENFNEVLRKAKLLGISTSEIVECQRIPQNNILRKDTEEALEHNQNQKQIRVQNHQDLKERLVSHDFFNLRLLPAENGGDRINFFGCACPYQKITEDENDFFDDERTEAEKNIDNQKTHATNQRFLFNELDAVISLVERDENNDPDIEQKDYAGTEKKHPINNVYSIPISDFHPPRFEHYLTLAKEMGITSTNVEPRGIGIFCGFGEGRTGTLLAASQVISEFKQLDSESRKQLLNTTRNFNPDIFGGRFSYLDKHFKTTAFVGNIVQNLRQLEKNTTSKQVGISVETPAQFETLEILQCMLAVSETLKDTPPISDAEILELINEQNFSPEPLEEFFQIDYSRPAGDVILEAVKNLCAASVSTST